MRKKPALPLLRTKHSMHFRLHGAKRNDILPPRQFYLCMLYAPVSYGNYFTGNP